MSNHDIKIRYKMTSLLACKNFYIFLPNIRTRPLRSVRFGSVRKCHVRRTSVRFGGSATALVSGLSTLTLPCMLFLLPSHQLIAYTHMSDSEWQCTRSRPLDLLLGCLIAHPILCAKMLPIEIARIPMWSMCFARPCKIGQ